MVNEETPVFHCDVTMTATRSSSFSADRSTTSISCTLDMRVNAMPSVQHLLEADPFSTSVSPVAVTSRQGGGSSCSVTCILSRYPLLAQ